MTPRTQVLVAGGAAAACILAWALGFFLPWLDTGARDVDRDALADGIGYERALVVWPAVALPVAAAALGTVGWTAVATTPARLRIRQTALVAALAASTVAGVAGMRLLGLQVARALDPGDPVITLLVPPYATLGAAALAATAAVAIGRTGPPASRPWLGKASIASAATLLALPLIPFGVADGGFALHYDELLLALAASVGTGPVAEAGRALAWTRGLLWTAAALGAALAVATSWAPRLTWLRRWGPLVAIPALAGATTMAATFQWKLWDVEGLRHGWNVIALAGALVALALQANACAVAWRGTGPAATEPTEPAAGKA